MIASRFQTLKVKPISMKMPIPIRKRGMLAKPMDKISEPLLETSILESAYRWYFPKLYNSISLAALAIAPRIFTSQLAILGRKIS